MDKCDVTDCEEEMIIGYCQKHYWGKLKKHKEQTLKEVLDLIDKEIKTRRSNVVDKTLIGEFGEQIKPEVDLIILLSLEDLKKEIKKLEGEA